jgi:hypothetical protein
MFKIQIAIADNDEVNIYAYIDRRSAGHTSNLYLESGIGHQK